MRLEDVGLGAVRLVHLDVAEDERGSFWRTFDGLALEASGLTGPAVQTSISRNTRAGTLRGLHFQRGEHAENKLVRCSRGALVDVVADILPGSPTYGLWRAFPLDESTPIAVLVPAGFAHGFMTLAGDTEVSYVMDTAYSPADVGGVRYDDPTLAVTWPGPPAVISSQDLALPLLDPEGLHASR